MRSLRFLSVFSGLGGLDLGLQRAGFSLLASVESSATARESLVANGHPESEIHKDVFDFLRCLRADKKLLKRYVGLDLIAAAPPCQPFSMAGQWSSKGRRGLEDPRVDTVRALLQIVELTKPRAVLIENVPGFVSGERSGLDRIRDAVRRIRIRTGVRYNLDFRVIDAADFGVPQHRRRVIVVLWRGRSKWHWPIETHRARRVTAYDALHDVRVDAKPIPRGRWTHLLSTIPEGQNYLFHTSRGAGRPLFGYRTRYWSFLLKLARDKPAWTLSAAPGPATGPFHWENRPLACEESLRLQSFPRRWKVAGGERAKVRQVGNATPPLLGEVLGRALGKSLFGRKYVSPLSLRIRRKRLTPAAVPPMVLEIVNLAAVSDHPGAGKGPSPRRVA